MAEAEKYACSLADRASRKGGVLSEDIRKDIAVKVAEGRERKEVLGGLEKPMAENFQAVDVTQLRGATNDLATVLLLDLDVHTPPQEPARSSWQGRRNRRTGEARPKQPLKLAA